MPRKYIYRKQMSGLLDFHGFREQTEEFLNDLDGDISAANAKIGNLSSLTTTDKSNLVAAINEAAQSGGGGGGEEQFQKVYETTLTDAEPQEYIAITAEGMGGVFVDVVVDIHNDTPLATDTEMGVSFSADMEDEVEVANVTFSITHGASWSATASVMSVGGLSMTSKTVLDIDYTATTGWTTGNIVYPSESVAGVGVIFVGVVGGYIPAGTTITVYARKPVTTPAE